MRAVAPVILACAGLCLGACAQGQAAPGAVSDFGAGAQCFQAQSARTYMRVGQDALIVRAGPGETYRMELLDLCPDLDWSNDVAFRARGGQSFICSKFDAELSVPAHGSQERCLFRDIRRLDDAEVAALPAAPVKFFRPWRPERRWPPVLRRFSPTPPTPSPPSAGGVPN